MSSSVFKDFDDDKHLSSKDDECEDENLKLEQNLVILVNKNGKVSVDERTLHSLLANETANTSVSIVSVASPTPSMQEEMDEEDRKHLELTDSELMKTLTEGDDLSSDSTKKEPPAPRIGVTVENYYSPAEAKNFVKEVLTLAGIDNPIAIDYEFQRFVIQNDHCYTTLLSPVKEKPQPVKKLLSKNAQHKQTPVKATSAEEEQPKDEVHNLRSVRVRKPSVKLIESITTEKEPPKEVETKTTNDVEQVAVQEDTGSEYESEMTASSSEDNDKDSDLDFDINRLNRPPKKGKKKKKLKRKAASKNLSKIIKKRHSSKSVDSEMENILRELDGGKEKKVGQPQVKTPKKLSIVEKKLPQRKVVSKGKQPPISTESADTTQPSTSTSIPESIQPLTSVQEDPVPIKPDPPKIITLVPAPSHPKKEKKKDLHLDVLYNDMSALFSKPDKIKTTKPVIQSTSIKLAQASTSSVSPIIKENKIIPVPGTSQNVTLIPELEKQLDLIDSIVQKELETPTTIVEPDMPEEIPNIVKLLENQVSENIDDNALLETLGESLPEDFLQHVAELAENKEIQEIIDKQVLGVGIEEHHQQQTPSTSALPSTPTNIQQKSQQKQTKLAHISLTEARKHPLQVMRSDGRIITLPPIEVPTTRGAKKRAQTGDNPPPPIAITAATAATETPAKIRKSESKDGKETKKDRSREQSREKSTSRRSSINRSSTETRRDSTGANSGRSKRQITNPAVLALLHDQDDSESGESWNSEDDPDRLWCICRQPHNNRFMICCDGCEDWFHGKCVNITKAMGKQMEEQGKDWTCPNCIKKKREKEQPKITSFLNDSGEGQSSRASCMPCIVCKKPARLGSIYCSEDCIGRHAQNALVSTKIISPSKQEHGSSSKSSDDMDFDKQIQTSQIMKNKHDRVIVFEKETGRCLAGSSAPTVQNLKQWLKDHPTFQVVTPGTAQSEGIKAKQKQLKEIAKKMREDKDSTKLFSEPAKIQTKLKIGEHQKLTISSPKLGGEKARKLSLTSPPMKSPTTSQSVTQQGKLSGASSSTKVHIEKKIIKRQSSVEHQRTTPPSRNSERDNDMVRQKSREGLQAAVEERIADIKEEKAPRLNKEEIIKFAEEVENELYLLFNKDCGMKYRAKYRSLVFNIKDKKNLTLFRKICEQNLKPNRLVRMEPQELASQELAQWRENENKHQLEMIKKSELELLACSKNYVLKTHKGEEVVESKRVDRVELDPTVAVEDVVKVLNNSSITSTSEVKPTVATTVGNKDDTYYVKSYTHLDEPAHSSSGSGSHHKEKKHHSRSREDKPGTHKHKRKHSRSRDREERHKTHDKKSKHDKRSPEPRHEKKEKKHEKRELDKSKRLEKEEKEKKKPIKEFDIPAPTQEDYNLIDKILEGSHIVLDRPRTQQEEKIIKEKSTPKLYTPSVVQSSLQHESDQEPTSTVTIPTPPDTGFDSEKDESSPLGIDLPETIWSGTVNMIDVASFNIEAQGVSGDAGSIAMHLPKSLDVVGRIPPETVWDYIGKIRKSPNKEIIIIRFSSPNNIAYLTLYKYYDIRRRLGVIKSTSSVIKDFYILPLAAEKNLPSVLLPIKGTGFIEGKGKPDLLVGVIVKIQSDKIRQSARQKVNKQIPLLPPIITKQSLENIDPSYSVTEESTPSGKPKRSKLLSLGLPPRVNSEEVEEDEPYSPGTGSEDNDVSSSIIVKTTTVVTTKTVVPEEEDINKKMEEINRQIHARKMEIAGMLNTDADSLDEPYSPSRPVTPPAGTSSSGKPSILPSLDKIAIPSNLSEILASIKSAANISTNTITTHEDVEYDPTTTVVNTYSSVTYSTSNYSGTISEAKQENVTDLEMVGVSSMNDSDSNSATKKRKVINIDEEPGNDDDCFEIPSEEGVKRTRWENNAADNNITDEALLAEAAGDLDLRILGNQ